VSVLDPTLTDQRDRALAVLCSPELGHAVELVVFSPAPGLFEVHCVDGMVRFRREADGTAWRYEVTGVEGRDPLADQDPARFSPLAAELAARQPLRQHNAYPLAFERIAQLFDHPCAPDLLVLHTAAHRWNPHRGEHGSLDVIQSRAPFIASGAGVRRDGLVEGSCAMVDVAPTVLRLLGLAETEGVGPTGVVQPGRLLARQDGEPVARVLDPDAPAADHVVVVLFDGANANVLYDAAQRGAAPNVARLIENGTALAHGSIASLPSVTLPNHTTLLTGAHPGHHGVLHNAWYDRDLGRTVVTESPATWQEAMRWLFPGVETVHEAVHRVRPDAVTFSVNEPADRGADYSTFELFREGRTDELAALVGDPIPYSSGEWMAASKDFRWGSIADTIGLCQATGLWSGSFLGRTFPLPTFTWVSFSLTDASNHEGGPHSDIAAAALADSDARLGALLEVIEGRGVSESTAILLVADHGMEENEEGITADWGSALAAAGLEMRDEASGFLYLGVAPSDG
jgi:phosphonoacetate hydrolase